MEENALSPGPHFSAIVMIQATWELPVITVSKPTCTLFSMTAGKLERGFVRGRVVL